MAIKFKARCMTCNAWLGDDPQEHLTENPTHIASEIMYDDAYVTPLESEPMTRSFNGELYMYDEDRGLYVSVNRHQVQWGLRSNNARRTWLRLSGSMITDNKAAGHRVVADAVITKIIFSRVSGGAAKIYICKNYNKSDIIVTADLEDQTGLYSLEDNKNEQIDEGETLHCYHESSSGSKDPYVSIEFAWRID